ncbi:uncharacterized protein LOC126378519 isoform X4 [Pectinophora gossypiella]|uniref:uncharacterized protein LOC126378519 isoform X3 n=1 Tax=Pectinophora gossypiella TaxID=13191 RepID=UPI00214F1BF4|nr:uncharacterized protein LOC126378519 isoform X3 [Pectinophora gossypiella]XP_049882892.1 uncharacterized protein LOC126378519 isoform X4 [Pectinophora gossypiella]
MEKWKKKKGVSSQILSYGISRNGIGTPVLANIGASTNIANGNLASRNVPANCLNTNGNSANFQSINLQSLINGAAINSGKIGLANGIANNLHGSNLANSLASSGNLRNYGNAVTSFGKQASLPNGSGNQALLLANGSNQAFGIQIIAADLEVGGQLQVAERYFTSHCQWLW